MRKHSLTLETLSSFVVALFGPEAYVMALYAYKWKDNVPRKNVQRAVKNQESTVAPLGN